MGRPSRVNSGSRWSRPATAAVGCFAAVALLVLGLMRSDHDSRLVFGTDAESASSSSLTPASSDPARLFVDPVLLVKLQTLADGLNNEIVLCLTGTVDGGAGHATDFVMPTVHSSTPTSSSVDGCPPETIGVWHNHTPVGTAIARMARSWNGSSRQPRAVGVAAELCRLSRRDIETLSAADYPFAVISVDRDTWCWWTRDQLMWFAADAENAGHPVEGQLHTRS